MMAVQVTLVPAKVDGEQVVLSYRRDISDLVAAREEKKRAPTRLAGEFDTTVGSIASAVSAAAKEIETTASSLTATADTATQRVATVAAASQTASSNVQSVAGAGEQLSSSVAESTGRWPRPPASPPRRSTPPRAPMAWSTVSLKPPPRSAP